VPYHTVEIAGDERRDREVVRYFSERRPDVGETIEAGGVLLVVENVGVSIDPEVDAVFIEARRLEPPE
jgi:hypothetical protein